MLEWFTETTGRQRLIYGLIGIGVCLVLLFAFGLVWFWLWAVSAVLLLSSMFGEWRWQDRHCTVLRLHRSEHLTAA